MDFHKGQSDIFLDPHRFRVVNCGRRFGKTTLAVVEMVAKAVSQKDLIISYIAPTFQQARDISWNMLVKIADPIIKNKNETRLELTLKTKDGGTSLISLRGWESIETMRGMRNDLLILDEVSSYKNFWTNWQEVLRPTLTDTKGQCLFISTPKGFNHFYDLYNLESVDTDYKSFQFTSYDNPFLPKEELDKAKQEITEDRFAQEYLADFRKTQGLVYKEFDRKRHLFSSPEELKKANYTKVSTLIGIDWGYTNPCAILKVYKDHDAHYWFVEEYYKTQKTDDEIKEYARSLGGNFYYPDPAEPDRLESLRRLGLNVRDVSNDIEAGINAVRALFKENRIHIHSSLVNLISELETYSYPDKKAEHNENELPIDENNHAVAAMRYILYMQQPAGMRNEAKQYVPKSHIKLGNYGIIKR